LDADDDANKRLYGKTISPKEIVIAGAVKATPRGETLISLLNSKVVKHKS